MDESTRVENKEAKKGSKEWRYLRDTYHVTQSLIIQKIFLVAPWKGPGLQFSWKEWSSKAWIFKLLCHVILLVLVTSLIVLINWQWAGYQRAANAISCRYFLPDNEFCSFDECIGYLSSVHPSVDSYGCTLFQRQDVQSSIINSVRQYYHINTTSIAHFEHPFQNSAGNAFDNCQPNSNVPGASIQIIFTNGMEQKVNLFPQFSLEQGEEKIKYLLSEENVRHISNIQLSFPLWDTLFIDIYDAQYLWNFQVNYDKDNSINSFEVSSSQEITHICGIENHRPLQESTTGSSGGRGYVYSFEYGIQVTAVLTILVSTLYLVSLVLDLMDNMRVTFYVMDMVRHVSSTKKDTTAPNSEEKEEPCWNFSRLWLYWQLIVSQGERFLRWLVRVPLISRAESERLSAALLTKQFDDLDALDAAEQATTKRNRAEEEERKSDMKDNDNSGTQEKFAPAALYNISHLLNEQLTNNNNNNTSTAINNKNSAQFDASSVQSTPSGSVSQNMTDTLPSTTENSDNNKKKRTNREPMTAEDRQRRLLKFWQQLSFRVKLRVLDGWRLLSIVGAIVALAAACIFTLVTRGYFAAYFPGGVIGSDSPRLMLGLAAAIQYLTLLSYFRYSNRFTASALVLWGAFFKVQRIFISILPLAVGLALLGILVFGNSAETFGDLQSMTITLFSLMNCDSIWQIFVDTTTFSRSNVALVGTLYVTAIFIVFNYLLLRLVLAVVESLYYYLRLYTNARRKRGLFRAQILQRQENGNELKEYATASGVRAHSSQEIQLSLFRVYAKQFLQQQQQADGNMSSGATNHNTTRNNNSAANTNTAAVSSTSGNGASSVGMGMTAPHRESGLADALLAAMNAASASSSSSYSDS